MGHGKHEHDHSRMEGEIQIGDTFRKPKFRQGNRLQTFDRVVANPMWNQNEFKEKDYDADELDRFPKGAGYPGNKADWGWMQHILASMNNKGRAAVVLDTGAASRGSGNANTNKEKDVRRWFVEQDLIEGVIYLPENLFHNTTLFSSSIKPSQKIGRASCSCSTTARADYYNGDVPFVKTTDVMNNRIKKSQTHVSNQTVNDCGLKLYPPGAVLMAMYGQGKTRGQAALLEISAATSQNAAAIQPSKEIISEFLWQYLISRYQVLRSSGVLGHISHLNLGYVRDFKIPKPPILVQREIAEILGTIDGRLTLIDWRRRLFNDLFRTLLHQLMTAEIRVNELELSTGES
jgi:hypothetical protein